MAEHAYNDGDLFHSSQAVCARKAFHVNFSIFASQKISPSCSNLSDSGRNFVSGSFCGSSVCCFLSFRLLASPALPSPRTRHRGHRVFLEIPALPPGSHIYSAANPGLRFGTQIKDIKALLCERTFASSQKARARPPACVHGADKGGCAAEVTAGC